MESKKNQQFDFSVFIMPLIEILNYLILELIKLITIGIEGMTSFVGITDSSKAKKLERSDLENTKESKDFNAIGYSVSQNMPFYDSLLNRKMHSVVIGSSGSGKTVLLERLMFSDMRDGKSLIFIDPKNDNETMERFISFCKLSNRDYAIFSEHYTGINGLKLNPAKEGSYTQIADRIFKSFTWSEEHYANKSYQGLKKAIKLLQTSNINLSLDVILTKLKELTHVSKDHKDYLNSDKVDGIITKLENIVDTDFASLLDFNDSYSFDELRKTKKCIYIGLPVQGYMETAQALGKLIISDINYSVYKTYKESSMSVGFNLNPAALYVDELSAFISDEYIQLLNKCRGAKLEITSAFQSLSDINKVNPELTQQLLENSLNWFIMKQRMQRAAEDICSSIGTIESFKDTVRIEDGEQQTSGSQRKVEELLVHPNLVKSLNQGQCILLRQQPTRIDLINVKYIGADTINRNLRFYEKEEQIEKELTSTHKEKVVGVVPNKRRIKY